MTQSVLLVCVLDRSYRAHGRSGSIASICARTYPSSPDELIPERQPLPAEMRTILITSPSLNEISFDVPTAFLGSGVKSQRAVAVILPLAKWCHCVTFFHATPNDRAYSTLETFFTKSSAEIQNSPSSESACTGFGSALMANGLTSSLTTNSDLIGTVDYSTPKTQTTKKKCGYRCLKRRFANSTPTTKCATAAELEKRWLHSLEAFPIFCDLRSAT